MISGILKTLDKTCNAHGQISGHPRQALQMGTLVLITNLQYREADKTWLHNYNTRITSILNTNLFSTFQQIYVSYNSWMKDSQETRPRRPSLNDPILLDHVQLIILVDDYSGSGIYNDSVLC